MAGAMTHRSAYFNPLPPAALLDSNGQPILNANGQPLLGEP